jgi:bifunctional non-homologous end joining protein LigD
MMDFGDIQVALTHVDRVVFPADGIQKGEVIAYYRDVAGVMLPELRRRALTIERFTKSIDAGGFYQKHAPKHYPAWIDRIELRGKTPVIYPICDSAAALVYLANQGAVTFHVMTSRAEAPEEPDEIVFDLDPPEGGFELVRRVARLVHELLEAIALPSFVKTTGSKGLHVVAPLDGAEHVRVIMRLAEAITTRLCRQHPDLITTEFYKADRKGRLFFDTMRNTPGATMVAPYSLRPRAGAPVSAPIEWRDVDDPALRADGITLRDVRARLDAHGDPWSTLRARVGSASAALAALAALDP